MLNTEKRIEIAIRALEHKKKTGGFYHEDPEVENSFLDAREFALLQILYVLKDLREGSQK